MLAESGLQLYVEYIGYKFTSSPSTNQSKSRAANLIEFSWIENFQQLENKSKIMQMWNLCWTANRNNNGNWKCKFR